MILARHYCTAILAAMLIHLAGLFVLSYSVAGGAVDKGEQGIEVDLGMLGDLGSATETQQSSATEAPPIETNELSKETGTAKPIEKKVVQKIEQQLTQELETPVELRQSAEITVKKEPAKQYSVQQDSVKQVEKIDREKQPVESVEHPKAAAVTEQTIAPLQAPLTTSAEASNPQEKNQRSALKMSTGSADALTSGGAQGYKKSYYTLIAATLAKHKRYPKYARKKGQEGTVLVSFTLLNSGLVKDIKIKQSSGYRQLDRAVKKMLQEASPLPVFPAQQTAQEINISIPIVFKLNQ